MSKRCPNCKGTKFSVAINGFQEWDSQDDEWAEVEVVDIDKHDAYFCVNCQHTYSNEDELEEFEDE